MAAVNISLVLECQLGSETIRLEANPSFSNVAQKHDVIKKLLENAADGTVTLYDQAVDHINNTSGNFDLIALVVDPEAAKSNDYDVAVGLTDSAGNVFRVNVSRQCPLILTSDKAGTIAAMASKITKIEARNNNAAATSPDSNADLLVRLLMLRA